MTIFGVLKMARRQGFFSPARFITLHTQGSVFCRGGFVFVEVLSVLSNGRVGENFFCCHGTLATIIYDVNTCDDVIDHVYNTDDSRSGRTLNRRNRRIVDFEDLQNPVIDVNKL